MRFVDTSILLYAISRDPAEQDKAKRANDILAERRPGRRSIPQKRWSLGLMCILRTFRRTARIAIGRYQRGQAQPRVDAHPSTLG